MFSLTSDSENIRSWRVSVFREAVRRIVPAFDNPKICPQKNENLEDVKIGHCAEKLGFTFVDTRDAKVRVIHLVHMHTSWCTGAPLRAWNHSIKSRSLAPDTQLRGIFLNLKTVKKHRIWNLRFFLLRFGIFQGRHRMLPFDPAVHFVTGLEAVHYRYLYYPYNATEVLWKISKISLKLQRFQFECCAEYMISFHYIDKNLMHFFEFLIYHAKIHGKDDDVDDDENKDSVIKGITFKWMNKFIEFLVVK